MVHANGGDTIMNNGAKIFLVTSGVAWVWLKFQLLENSNCQLYLMAVDDGYKRQMSKKNGRI
jgi:hypothetical protein